MENNPEHQKTPQLDNQQKLTINRLKTRRRIEDALRKTANDDQLITIAKILGVKVELE